jgi:cytidylate kinase
MIPVITIDGPSSAGKGKISQLLAHSMGYHFLDSGAIYRTLALVAQRKKISLQDEIQLSALAATIHIECQIHQTKSHPTILLAGQEDVSDLIRTQEISLIASKISQLPSVRAQLLEKQREHRKAPGLVADGRDMGTVVFPDATIKLFLTASLEERAKRRYQQLLQQGETVILSHLIQKLRERDKQDETRKIAPLKAADDAIFIDTTSLSIQEVLEKVKAIVRNKLGDDLF